MESNLQVIRYEPGESVTTEPGRIDPGRPPGAGGEPDGGEHQYQPPADEVQRGRDEQLSSADDVEGAGVCVHRENLLTTADRERAAGECEHDVAERGNKPDFRTINKFHGETMKEDRAAEKPYGCAAREYNPVCKAGYPEFQGWGCVRRVWAGSVGWN